ncbi:hypothetical protein P6F26_02395 [Roseibacterium sp. SDUM158017]|nr:hypothetical protein [Roseibacterium sp. SDUM158017]MDG4647282.1 hypothetical protein [Roseibacterium sp. SDUM158017]
MWRKACRISATDPKTAIASFVPSVTHILRQIPPTLVPASAGVNANVG